REALKHEPDAILLDNMSNAMLKEAVGIVGGKAKTEASGGVRLDTVRAIAETGVDYISVGALTHSAVNLDIGLDYEIDRRVGECAHRDVVDARLGNCPDRIEPDAAGGFGFRLTADNADSLLQHRVA